MRAGGIYICSWRPVGYWESRPATGSGPPSDQHSRPPPPPAPRVGDATCGMVLTGAPGSPREGFSDIVDGVLGAPRLDRLAPRVAAADPTGPTLGCGLLVAGGHDLRSAGRHAAGSGYDDMPVLALYGGRPPSTALLAGGEVMEGESRPSSSAESPSGRTIDQLAFAGAVAVVQRRRACRCRGSEG